MSFSWLVSSISKHNTAQVLMDIMNCFNRFFRFLFQYSPNPPNELAGWRGKITLVQLEFPQFRRITTNALIRLIKPHPRIDFKHENTHSLINLTGFNWRNTATCLCNLHVVHKMRYQKIQLPALVKICDK